MGYVWIDDSIVSPPTLPGYVYDLNQETQTEPDNEGENDENRIVNDANIANQQHTEMLLKNGGKQLKLADCWKTTN
jgi:hypothetical protein